MTEQYGGLAESQRERHLSPYVNRLFHFDFEHVRAVPLAGVPQIPDEAKAFMQAGYGEFEMPPRLQAACDAQIAAATAELRRRYHAQKSQSAKSGNEPADETFDD